MCTTYIISIDHVSVSVDIICEIAIFILDLEHVLIRKTTIQVKNESSLLWHIHLFISICWLMVTSSSCSIIMVAKEEVSRTVLRVTSLCREEVGNGWGSAGSTGSTNSLQDFVRTLLFTSSSKPKFSKSKLCSWRKWQQTHSKCFPKPNQAVSVCESVVCLTLICRNTYVVSGTVIFV